VDLRETAPRDPWEIVMFVVVPNIVAHKIHPAIIAVRFLVLFSVWELEVFGKEMAHERVDAQTKYGADEEVKQALETPEMID